MNDKEALLLIGKNIQRLRNAKNIKQYQLAAMCNFEKANLSRIESGKTNATMLTIQKIATVLEIPMRDLFVDSSN